MNKHFRSEEFDPDKLALDNCDQEPIHAPGRVQPFAALLAGPLDLSAIDYASENCADFLSVDARDILGKGFDSVFTSQTLHDVRNVLSMSTSRAQRERAGRWTVNGKEVDIFVHRNPNDQAIVEVETASDDKASQTAVDRIRRILARAAQAEDITDMLKICAVGLQSITGYDRVMAYRYLSNGDGEVVAEARGADVDSFLGLRYPAWDVPTQARALQVKNPVRMLSDVEQEPVPLLASSDDLPDIDMSLAHTRGISPIHVEYLQNMGVGATLTIGLIVKGQLWGMFACHHMQAYHIGPDLRIAVEILGQMLSLIIQQKVEKENVAARARASEARRRILAETDAATDLLHAFPQLAPILLEVIDCDGVAVIRDDKMQTLHSVPSPEAIKLIAARLPDEDDLLEGTDALSKTDWFGGEELKKSAGCLHIRCTAAYPLQLMFFRDDKVSNVRWAGQPKKEIKLGSFGARLTPRGSFEAYLEQQNGHSEDWNTFDLEAGRELQILLTQITAKGERAQFLRQKDLVSHQRQQDLMIAELNHRVKNILALIRSLSRQAKASSASLESYAQALEQRIAALAAAHDLAVSDSMQGVSLRGILETELSPYLDGENTQVLMSGPTIGLRADVAPMIALVMHELVTNAAKYGALTTPDGVLRVKWSVDDEGLTFAWQEMNGPVVEPPERHGFGRSLIEKAIPYEFDGTAELDYKPNGVTFNFHLPRKTLVDITHETENKLVGKISEIRKVATGKSALLLEDNLVLAMDMVESLTRLGTENIENAGTIEEALRLLDRNNFDFAVLDMNIRGSVSFEVAEELQRKQIPFLFVTGYGSAIDIPDSLNETQVLTKPIDDGTLSSGLERLLG